MVRVIARPPDRRALQVLRAEGIDSAALAAALAAQPRVAYAVPDLRRRALRVPNDPLFLRRRVSRASAGRTAASGTCARPTPSRSAINAGRLGPSAGSPSSSPCSTPACASTMPTCQGRVLPGYDMISDINTANDGDGRDADPSDPGDWITVAENAPAAPSRTAASATAPGTAPGGGPHRRAHRQRHGHGRRRTAGVRASCRCGCWASAAATTPTSSPACAGRPAWTVPGVPATRPGARAQPEPGRHGSLHAPTSEAVAEVNARRRRHRRRGRQQRGPGRWARRPTARA
jgi:hypothetical protein